MAKLTLTDLSSSTLDPGVVSAINANSAATETALENTLSRDGTSPNTMAAQLDMNSNSIINLPAPTQGHHAVNREYVEDFLAAAEAGALDIVGSTEIHINDIDPANDFGVIYDASALSLKKFHIGVRAKRITDSDWGASTASADNTAAIQAAIDELADGQTLVVPEGDFYILGSGTQGLLLGSTNKSVHLVGDGPKSRILPTAAFPNTRDLIRVAPTTGTAHWSIKGLGLGSLSLTKGRDLIRIDTQDATEQAYFFDIEDVTFGYAETGRSIHHLSTAANATGGMPYSRITRCEMLNGIRFAYSGDKIIVADNYIEGTGFPCVEYGRISGAAQFTVQNNLMHSKEYGAIVLNSGLHVQIVGNEIEQTTPLSSATAIIDVQGDLESCDSPVIHRNSIAVTVAATGTCPAIRLDTCVNASVSDNWISVRGANYHLIKSVNSIIPYFGINTYLIDDVVTNFPQTNFADNSYLMLSRGGAGALTITSGGGVYSSSGFFPLSNNTVGLGASGLTFKNVYASGKLVHPKGSLTLANGANNDLALPDSHIIRITGPSGAFSVSGFAGGEDGRVITLYNPTANNMTITNDATSTAANRILTLTGADVTLTGTSSARFVYDATDNRWILLGTQG